MLEQVLLGTALMTLMLGVGCSLSLEDFRATMARPVGVLIGFASQFLWMPVLAMMLGWSLGLPGPVALALLLVGTSPGGTSSNIFTFYAKGDVSLSVTMTVLSSLVAIVMMPLWLTVYTQGAGADGLVIPYQDIAASIGFVLTPVGVGVAIRSWRARWADAIERAGTWIGYLLGLVMLAVWGPNFLSNVRWEQWPVYLAIETMVFSGMGLGYLSARLLGQARATRRAISLETGLQNCPFVAAIIALSFSEADGEAMVWVPLAYGAMSVGAGALVTFAYRMLDRRREREVWAHDAA